MENWPPTSNSSAPAINPSLQNQLTLIGGVMKDRRPRIRLVWGQSAESSIFWRGRQRLRYLWEWKRQLIGYRSIDANGNEPPKFFAPTVELPSFAPGVLLEPLYEDIDIGIPRWYVEQMMPAAIACDGWKDERYDKVDGTLVDSMGEPPVTGTYEEAFYMIADHSHCAHVPGYTCYGEYREPQQYDVEYVRWLFHQLNQEPYRYSWEEVPPPEVVVQALLDRKTALANAAAKKTEETAYIIKDAIAPHTLLGGGHFDLGASFARARRY